MPAEPTRNRVRPEDIDTTPKRRPEWIRVTAPQGDNFTSIKHLMRDKTLHTVCEEAMCPNMGECWGSGTATFLILGDVCTRSCRFCDVKHGSPPPIDWQEPLRTAEAVRDMELKHAVITSVNRDNRRDGGAPIFSMLIKHIRQLAPKCTVEVLIPDFKGSIEALNIVMQANPEILNHNVETVPRLFSYVQPQSNYLWSEKTLTNARKLNPNALTKSGLMVGLGEDLDEIHDIIRDMHSWGVDILTIGQYLQPSRQHIPIHRYYHPDEFAELKEFSLGLGFKWVESSPLVRSSYHALEQVRALRS